jgi:hypothetical protein
MQGCIAALFGAVRQVNTTDGAGPANRASFIVLAFSDCLACKTHRHELACFLQQQTESGMNKCSTACSHFRLRVGGAVWCIAGNAALGMPPSHHRLV